MGFVEAHGLALILAITLWRSAPARAAHFTGAAASGLLGACNLAFWHISRAACDVQGATCTRADVRMC